MLRINGSKVSRSECDYKSFIEAMLKMSPLRQIVRWVTGLLLLAGELRVAARQAGYYDSCTRKCAQNT